MSGFGQGRGSVGSGIGAEVLILIVCNELMHQAFRPCAVVEIPKERIDAIFAYGRATVTTRTDDRG